MQNLSKVNTFIVHSGFNCSAFYICVAAAGYYHGTIASWCCRILFRKGSPVDVPVNDGTTRTSSISVECKPPACREHGLHKI